MTAEEYTSIKGEVIQKIEEHFPEIRRRFGVETIGIFGSVARSEDTPESDVDILYKFEKGRGRLRDFMGFAEYLEELFGRHVDLVSVDYISPYIRGYVQADAIFCGAKAAIV